MSYNFCVFILTYNRAQNQRTEKTLRKIGYFGEIFFICSNDDPGLEEMKKIYGSHVVVFNKKSIKADKMDNFDGDKFVLYARNACFGIAEKLGYRYFLALDDDYTTFEHRFIENEKLKVKKVNRFNDICEYMFEFMNSSEKIKSVAFFQGGDTFEGVRTFLTYFGGKRKVMNSFFCDTKKPFNFYGRINEDATMYCLNGSRGDIYLSIPFVQLKQMQTQKQSGGLTEQYLDVGTYVKSFYTVMACPSFVKCSDMGISGIRIHHKINKNHAFPKIIEEKYKKTNATI